MTAPTLKQIYDKFMDTEHDCKEMLEVEIVQSGKITHVDIDWIMCDMITQFLEIPGMRAAVLVAALEHDRSGGYVATKGFDHLDDIPFQFVWNYLINPEEIGGIV